MVPISARNSLHVSRYSYFMRIGKPVIAALNGATAGLGIMALCAEMALCDRQDGVHDGVRPALA